MEQAKCPKFILRLAGEDGRKTQVAGVIIQTDFIPPIGSQFTVNHPAYAGANVQARQRVEVVGIEFESDLTAQWLDKKYDQACDVTLTVKEIYR